jgi:type IV pilus assembly protein PilQ
MRLHSLARPAYAGLTQGRRVSLIGLWSLLALCWAGIAGAQAPQNALTNVEVLSLPGDQVQVALKFATPPSEPLAFTIDNPARIALDFPNTRNALTQRSTNIGIGVTRSIAVAEARGRTRVVLNLSSLVGYETQVRGNEVLVTVAGSTTDALTAVRQTAAAREGATSTSAGAPPAVRGITDIDFRRGTDGAGRVVLTLSDASVPVVLNDQRGRIVLDVIGAQLPKELQQRLDVVDFATPAEIIEVFPSDGNARVVVTTSDRYEQLAYQSDNVFTLEIKPYTEEEAQRRREQEFTGERLSLNFQDIEVRSVLQLIADFTSLNVVVSDTVDGNLTLRLKNVPWDQALDIILKTKGLAMRQQDTVLYIAPAEEIAAREKLELEALRQAQELAPLRSEFVQVNYARAGDMAGLIGAEGSSLLSERGTVTVDPRTNTLLVQDTDAKINEIRALVRRLDIPVRQVLVESRIVIASDEFSRELGSRFGGSYVTSNNDNQGIVSVTGSAEGNSGVVNDALDNLQNTGQPFPVGVPGLNDRLISNLGVANPAGRLALAVLDSNYLIDLELSAAQEEVLAEVVSSPRVVTSNQVTARIEQGVEIPYQEATSSGATSITFKKAVLSLDVTPNITPDDRVFLDLAVNQDNVGEIFFGVPSIDTRRVTTQVLVDDGQTVVLGGIYQEETLEDTDKVPGLGDIPILGWLFKNELRSYDKSELLIFVTPKIMREGGFATVAR